MASRSDIRAGAAFVELSLKNSDFLKGLRRSGDQLRDFGKGIAVMGAAITAAGAAMLGPIVLGVKKFTESGEALYEMSKRTGVSAEALAQLGYAAKQSGTDLEGVEGALRKMQKFLGAAEAGTKEATTELIRLGLSIADLKALSPEAQFEKIGAKIAGIADPTEKAAEAMKVFGKSGTMILPLLDNLDKVAEARRLGIGPSEKEVKLAHELSIGFNSLAGVADSLARSLGAAVAPAIVGAIEPIRKIVLNVKSWLSAHSELVQKIAAGGAVLVGLGTALVVVGGAISLVGSALGKIASPIKLAFSLFGAITSLASALLTPFGLIAAALGVGVFLWAKYTASGQAAVAGISSFLGKLGKTFSTTFAGIKDAIMAGNLGLAGSLAMAGLRVAMLQGFVALSSAVGGEVGDFIGKLGAQLAGGNFAGAWDTMVVGMGTIWAQFSQGVVTVFVKAANAVISAWRSISGAIADSIQQFDSGLQELDPENWKDKFLLAMQPDEPLRSEIEARIKARTRAHEEATPKGRELKARQAIIDNLLQRLPALDKELHGGGLTPERKKAIRAELDEIKASAERAATGHQFGEIKASDIIGKQAGALRSPLDDLQRQADENARKAREKFKGAGAGGADAASDALRQANAERDEMLRQAAAEAKAAAAKNKEKVGALPGADLGAMRSETFGTFSAVAAQLAGGAGNPVVNHLKTIIKQGDEQKKWQAEVARLLWGLKGNLE